MSGRTKGTPNPRITMPMIARMKQLRSAGLSAPAVAAVIALDFGVRIGDDTIRKYAPLGEHRQFGPGNHSGRLGMGH